MPGRQNGNNKKNLVKFLLETQILCLPINLSYITQSLPLGPPPTLETEFVFVFSAGLFLPLVVQTPVPCGGCARCRQTVSPEAA